MASEFDDMGDCSACCQHCGDNVEVSDEEYQSDEGWVCPECGELNES